MLDQLHIITQLLIVHYRWKPQLPGDEQGTHCLEVNEAKTTSADVFKGIYTSTLQFYTWTWKEFDFFFLFFFKWQLISQESSVTEEKISRRETKLLAADSTQRLLYGAMS